MDVFGFKTVDSLPALYHPELDILAVSDLHLGLEKAVSYDGNYVPKFQLEEIKEDIRTLKEQTDASRILLNGDLKHEFSHTRFSEKEEIEEFFKFLQRVFQEIIVIEGNHDTYLEDIIPEENLFESFLEDGVLFTHGHRSIEDKEFETLVIGHEHPALKLEDEIGITEKFDCLLYGQMEDNRNIIVLPAFSKMAGGSGVNKMPSSELLSPVLRDKTDVRTLKAIAIDKEAGIFEFPRLHRIQ
ncbi:metallophosphoesterase [Candidatus Nanohalococcus occultus]|uniref:Phosphohydrolase, MPP superfamily n=1 Tax=Candidatus Nanohalococcus occultus TaxID=2978047 RepID=A0ABY8CF93_9ARCH|nr:Putative phosphohydrolase, MPP superfamily [Candidatus Nanohaloarchaeota archaeon SVXNc]